MQREDAWSDDVTPERYLERCRLKTARLFEAACRLGALLGDPGPDAAAALGVYGDRIGLAFQIFDDVLDVSGPTERTGKPRGTDLLDGTVTLPLILARERDPACARSISARPPPALRGRRAVRRHRGNRRPRGRPRSGAAPRGRREVGARPDEPLDRAAQTAGPGGRRRSGAPDRPQTPA